MSFFNRKEEVLEVQLTPHGRYLLSLGEFQPVYYSFFDDDIVYDSNYIGYSEEQNSTEDRIRETSRSHCQTTFRTTELNAANVYEYNNRKLQNYFEREDALSSQLGTADYYSVNAPSWDVSFLKGKISTTSAVYSGSGPNYAVPQINTEHARYKKFVGPPGTQRPLFGDEDLRVLSEFRSGFIDIRKDFLLLEINELNSIFQKENFEIEIFKVEEDTEGATSTEVLIPLKFEGPRLGYSEGDLKKDYVDYYFNLDVDMEINERTICKYKGVDTTKGLYLQGAFDCKAPPEGASTDQYGADITGIGEVCD